MILIFRWALLTIGLLTASHVSAQTNQPDQPHITPTNSAVGMDYEIGPGDVLSITVSDAPEFTGKFRVGQSGKLEITALAQPLEAQGRTALQLSRDLREALVDAKLYRNPTVNVYVDEFHSRNVTILGAVAKPSIYSLQRPTTLVELISLAGGLMPNAGPELTITSAGNRGATSTRTISLTKLMRGEDSSLNVVLQDGDSVSIATAAVVYVVGAVTKPGGFVLPDQSSGMTALQALAMAEGLTPIAAQSRGLIIRRSSDGSARENIPLDLATLMSGKGADVKLQANDILFVPVSGSRQTLRVMGQIAMSAVNGMAIYGVGYRVGGL